jgi:hypothetical protein
MWQSIIFFIFSPSALMYYLLTPHGNLIDASPVDCVPPGLTSSFKKKKICHPQIPTVVFPPSGIPGFFSPLSFY